VLRDAEPRRRLRFMDDRTTMMNEETGPLRFWRAAVWIGLLAACVIFWIAAGVAIIHWIF
jgi:hypothetical protein